jgi:hypothetical protein
VKPGADRCGPLDEAEVDRAGEDRWRNRESGIWWRTQIERLRPDAMLGEGGDDDAQANRQQSLSRPVAALGHNSMCCSRLGFGWVKGC